MTYLLAVSAALLATVLPVLVLHRAARTGGAS